jgi:pilus assembly protein CpaE
VQPEIITVSVLFGTGKPRAEIQEVLESLPQLKLLGQACDPQELLAQHETEWPDLLLVEIDGGKTVPDWLENLIGSLPPQTTVLLCSSNRDPDFLIRAMQVGVREFLPLPLHREELDGAVTRAWQSKKRLQAAGNRQGQVIVVTGHKGGVGATTVAVNLAVALSELLPERLALMDMGRPFPDVANFLDQEINYSITDLIQNFASLDSSFIQRIMQPYGKKIAILHGAPDFKEHDSLELETVERIFSLLRAVFRYIIVDLSHWLDDLFIQVLMEADQVLMVTGLSVPDLRNLKKLWPMFHEWRLPQNKIKMVVNRYDRGNGLQLRDMEQIVHQPVFHTLPSDYFALMDAMNQGTPLNTNAPRSKLWRSLDQLAERIKGETPQEAEEPESAAASKRRFWVFSKART